jgi:hypothetical protein
MEKIFLENFRNFSIFPIGNFPRRNTNQQQRWRQAGSHAMRPPITTESRGCATGVTVKMVAASATVALNDVYHAFLIFQSYICYVINLFVQKRKPIE